MTVFAAPALRPSAAITAEASRTNLSLKLSLASPVLNELIRQVTPSGTYGGSLPEFAG